MDSSVHHHVVPDPLCLCIRMKKLYQHSTPHSPPSRTYFLRVRVESSQQYSSYHIGCNPTFDEEFYFVVPVESIKSEVNKRTTQKTDFTNIKDLNLHIKVYHYIKYGVTEEVGHVSLSLSADFPTNATDVVRTRAEEHVLRLRRTSTAQRLRDIFRKANPASWSELRKRNLRRPSSPLRAIRHRKAFDERANKSNYSLFDLPPNSSNIAQKLHPS